MVIIQQLGPILILNSIARSLMPCVESNFVYCHSKANIKGTLFVVYNYGIYICQGRILRKRTFKNPGFAQYFIKKIDKILPRSVGMGVGIYLAVPPTPTPIRTLNPPMKFYAHKLVNKEKKYSLFAYNALVILFDNFSNLQFQ